jgi:hypothetical protein
MKGWRDRLWLLPGIAATALAIPGIPPGVTAGDSGELASAAFLLGTGHPPGQAFYLLLAKAASLALPFGSVPFRLGLLSALATGAAVAVITRLAQQLAGTGAAIIAGFAFLLLPTVRDTAALPEIYPLFWLAVALLLFGALLIPRLTAGAAGVCAAIHPEGVLLLPAAALGGAWRLLPLAAVPLAVLTYPWLRLAAGTPVTWWLTGDLQTSLAFITAAPYRGTRILQAWYPDRWARLADLGVSALPLLPWLLLAILGWRHLSPNARRVLAAVAAADLFYASLMNPVPPSMTPALVPLAMALLLPATLAAGRATGPLRPVATLLLALPALLSLLAPLPLSGRTDNLAGDYAVALSSPLPPVSTVALGSEDNDIFPQMALQWIGGHRPDCRFTSPVGRLFPDPPENPRIPAVRFDRFGDRPPSEGLRPSPDGLLYRWDASSRPPRWYAAPVVRLGAFPTGDPLRNLMTASWLDRLALHLEVTGDPAAALLIRRRLATALPRDAGTQGLLGSALLGFANGAEALAPLSTAVTLAPGDHWWRFLRGAALLMTGHEPEARPELHIAAAGLRGTHRAEAARLLRFWGFPGYGMLFAGEGLP